MTFDNTLNEHFDTLRHDNVKRAKNLGRIEGKLYILRKELSLLSNIDKSDKSKYSKLYSIVNEIEAILPEVL